MKNYILIAFFLMTAVLLSAQTPNSLGQAGETGIEDFFLVSSEQMDSFVVVNIGGTEIRVLKSKDVVISDSAPVGTAIAKIWIDSLGTDSSYFNNGGSWVLFSVGGIQQGAPFYRTNNQYSTFTPNTTPPIGAMIWDSDMGSLNIKIGTNSYAPYTEPNGLLVRNGDRFVVSGNVLSGWDIMTHAAAKLNVLTGSTGTINAPSSLLDIQRGRIAVVSLSNPTGSPVTFTFASEYKENTVGTTLSPVVLQEESEIVYIFISEQQDGNMVLRLVSPTATGGDNLGSHSAGQNLDMNQFNIIDVNRINTDSLASPVIVGATTVTGDLSVPDEVYNATNWNGVSESPTKNALRDEIEAIRATIPDVSNKVTKGGDTGALLEIGTNDNSDVRFERNGLPIFELLALAIDFKNKDLINIDSGLISAPNFIFAPTQEYTNYTSGATLTRRKAHYVDATSDAIMTATSAVIPDKTIFFIKNDDPVFKVTLEAGGTLTTLGNMIIPAGECVWFQRVGNQIKRISSGSRGQYVVKTVLSTDAQGNFSIAHPFGNAEPTYTSCSLKADGTNPLMVLYKTFTNGSIQFTAYKTGYDPPLQQSFVNQQVQILIIQ